MSIRGTVCIIDNRYCTGYQITVSEYCTIPVIRSTRTPNHFLASKWIPSAAAIGAGIPPLLICFWRMKLLFIRYGHDNFVDDQEIIRI